MQTDRKNYIVIASACFFIQAIGVGTFVTYGVFFNSLLEEFQWSRAVISGASSTAFLLSGLFAMVVGRLNDQYGPRILMSIAACLFGTGMIMTSFVTEIWQLYLFYGLLFGLGLSAIDVIALTTTARWFTRSRGAMTGIVKVGTGAGQFAIPFLASLLIISYGWRNSYVILGLLALVSLLLIAQTLKRDPDHLLKNRETGSGVSPVQRNDTISGLNAVEALRTSQLWLLLCITLLTEYCLLTVLVHIVPHGIDLGLSPAQAAGVLSTIGAVSMLGRFFTGISIDRFGCKALAFICFAMLLLSLVWLLYADNLWMLYVFGAIYGLAHGSFFTFISPIVVEIFGLLSHGAIFGIVVFSGTAGGAFGPIVAGMIFDATDNYTLVFKILTALSIVVFGLVAFLKPLENRDQLRR